MTFISGLPGREIVLETGMERRRVFKALLLIRALMGRDIPEEFSGVVAVEQTFRRDQWKQAIPSIESQRGRGTQESPVFGILCREGKVWVEIIPDSQAQIFFPLIDKQVQRELAVYPDTWNRYTGIAAKGCVHEIADRDNEENSFRSGNHINGLAGFWGYLKRKLAAKGGIRKERLPLYLAEYVWRYNHRDLSLRQQADQLFKLLSAKMP